MEHFYGFDLGDAESAVSHLKKDDPALPEMLPVAGAESFISAYALMPDSTQRIGEAACYLPGAVKRGLRFKTRFLTDRDSRMDIRRFASGVLTELYTSGAIDPENDGCFYIGCPAGWNAQAREDYRRIFEDASFPPLRIISESRAAMVSACQSRHLQVGYDILSRPVLVVDIGSSTTDFAYIMGGREVEMRTAGEVALGGGLMDEMILEEAVKASGQSSQIKEIFAKSDAWRTYCEFAARKCKETYFSDEDYWRENGCRQTVRILYETPVRLTVSVDERIAKKILEGPMDRLEGRSFREVFVNSLQNVRAQIGQSQPELIFLTGGVSRLSVIQDWCLSVFPDAIVIRGKEPEFAVSRGLAWCGRIDDDLRDFREELQQLNSSHIVEEIVQKHIFDLYRSVIDTLVDPIIDQVAASVFARWRSGEIRRLADTDAELQRGIEEFLRSDEAKERLRRPVAEWLKPVAGDLEEHTMPICAKHNIPYTALSLTSYLKASEIDIHIDAKNVFGVDELTWLFDSLVSVIIGLLCGGSGIAILSSGPAGILAGAMASFLLLLLGKGPMEAAFLKADLPIPMRKLAPKHSIENRKDILAGAIRQNFYYNSEEEKNAALTERMVEEISTQIEKCLTSMAEIVEIPLG